MGVGAGGMECFQGVNASVPCVFEGGIVTPMGAAEGVNVSFGLAPFLEAVELKWFRHAVVCCLCEGLVYGEG